MPETCGPRSVPQDVATRWAQRTVAIIFFVGVVLVGLEAYRTRSAPLGPAETTTTTRTTNEVKTTTKGTESTEKREVTTALKETTLERALGQPGLWLVRLLLIVLVAFFSGAAVQRILIGEFSLKLGPIEVPPLPTPPTDALARVPDAVVEAFQAEQVGGADFEPGIPKAPPLEVSSSHIKSLLEQIQGPGASDYAVINLGTGRNWLTTRLFLFAILLRRMRMLRTFVFVETRDGIEQRFAGVAAPDLVRWRFAREYPWLETAFAHAYGAIENREIRSDVGALDPFVAGRLVEEFMKSSEIQARQGGSRDDWDRLQPETWEHARWINRTLLDRILDLAPARTSVVDVGDLTGTARTLAVLACEGPFVALVDNQTRFRSLIDRQGLLDAVARGLVAGSRRA